MGCKKGRRKNCGVLPFFILRQLPPFPPAHPLNADLLHIKLFYPRDQVADPRAHGHKPKAAKECDRLHYNQPVSSLKLLPKSLQGREGAAEIVAVIPQVRDLLWRQQGRGQADKMQDHRYAAQKHHADANAHGPHPGIPFVKLILIPGVAPHPEQDDKYHEQHDICMENYQKYKAALADCADVRIIKRGEQPT